MIRYENDIMNIRWDLFERSYCHYEQEKLAVYNCLYCQNRECYQKDILEGLTTEKVGT